MTTDHATFGNDPYRDLKQLYDQMLPTQRRPTLAESPFVEMFSHPAFAALFRSRLS